MSSTNMCFSRAGEAEKLSERLYLETSPFADRIEDNYSVSVTNTQISTTKTSNGVSATFRSDVVFKTILRKIRKEYLSEFNV